MVTGGTAVTGVGTYWDLASIQEGDMFLARGLTVPIASVDSATQITLAMGWPGTALSGSAYFVKYEQMSNRTTAKTIELINRTTELQDGVVSYEAQSPTAAERAQARSNLGLGGITPGVNTTFMSENGLARLVIWGTDARGISLKTRPDVSSTTWTSVPFPAATGGTGVTSYAALKTALGLGHVTTDTTTAYFTSPDGRRRLVIQNGGTASGDWWVQRRADTSSAWETDPLDVSRGGTGGTGPGSARTNLGLDRIVQATDMTQVRSPSGRYQLHVKEDGAWGTWDTVNLVWIAPSV